MNNSNNLIDSFSETLINDSTKEISVDLLDASIDTIISSDVVNEIPIVKTLISIGKTGIMLKNRNLIRQTLSFMNELNKGTVSHEKIEEYSQRIKSGDKKAIEEIERVMLILESTIDLEKSKILARFVAEYIGGGISYSEFQELTDILTRSYLSDMELLLQINKGEVEDTIGQESHRIERLAGMGLINKTLKMISFTGGQGRQDASVNVSSIGILYCEIGLLS